MDRLQRALGKSGRLGFGSGEVTEQWHQFPFPNEWSLLELRPDVKRKIEVACSGAAIAP